MSLHAITNLNISTDISQYSKIVIDTNVLLFIHGGYTLSRIEALKAGAYANLLSDLRSNKNEMFVSTITLQELFHVIEDKEFKLYKSANSLPEFYKKKTFRSDIIQRRNVKRKILSVYQQIESFYTILNYDEIHKSDIGEFLNTYDSHKFDPMDFVLTKNFNCYPTVFYVTDDKDFLSNPELEVISY